MTTELALVIGATITALTILGVPFYAVGLCAGLTMRVAGPFVLWMWANLCAGYDKGLGDELVDRRSQ